jgi:RNA polymerase sigma-70 factor, ECF subfamily
VRTRFHQLKTLAARLVGLQRSEAAALGDLYDRFAEDIYRYLYCRTGNPAQAEELTLQVFLQAQGNVPRTRCRSLPSWLLSLAESACAANDSDHLLECGENLAQLKTPGRLNPSVLAYALARVPRHEREVLLLKFASGLANGTIALSLGTAERAICDLQLRGLLGLHSALDAIAEQSGRHVEFQQPRA